MVSQAGKVHIQQAKIMLHQPSSHLVLRRRIFVPLVSLKLGDASANRSASLVSERPCFCSCLRKVGGRSAMSRIGNSIQREQSRGKAHHDRLQV